MKYPKNYTLKITTFNSNNPNINKNNLHTKTGNTINKLVPNLADLNLFQNLNLNFK